MASRLTYQKLISNKYLGVSKVIKASSEWELKNKINDQLIKWEKQESLARKKEETESLIQESEMMTMKAKLNIGKYKNILNESLSRDINIKWEDHLRDFDFPDFEYKKEIPTLEFFNKELKVPKESLLELIFRSFERDRERLESIAYEKYMTAKNKYEKEKDDVYTKYLNKKEAYVEQLKQHNFKIQRYMSSFKNNEYDIEAIEKFSLLILQNSSYPEELKKDFSVQYLENERILIISCKLPNPDLVPNIIEYKYNKVKGEIIPKMMGTREFEEFYDSVIFQIALKINHDIYKTFQKPFIEGIIFNGWVDYIDKATGLSSISCVLSVETTKEDFKLMNLSLVDYKECIKRFKGIYAGKLAYLAPVQPIRNLDKSDRRFIESKEILANINSINNLATMDWEDFEHLVTELFEKEFNVNGGEVKVTRASRDGGIDAVAFDPDPIKGGKFIIQAKRYNHTVPVSAVRDLYGTLGHEGAIKGILVTTSDYGRDSHDFAKNKPLTLINGQELLYYFNKHGYKDVNITLTKT